MKDLCHHCGLKVTRGAWHDGEQECLDELWGEVMFAGSKEQAIEALRLYGDVRFQNGFSEGRGSRKKPSEDIPGAPD